MEVKLQGTLMELKSTKKNGKPYLVIYSEGTLYSVFLQENENMEKYAQHLGKQISVMVHVYEPKFIRTV